MIWIGQKSFHGIIFIPFYLFIYFFGSPNLEIKDYENTAVKGGIIMPTRLIYSTEGV